LAAFGAAAYFAAFSLRDTRGLSAIALFGTALLVYQVVLMAIFTAWLHLISRRTDDRSVFANSAETLRRFTTFQRMLVIYIASPIRLAPKVAFILEGLLLRLALPPSLQHVGGVSLKLPRPFGGSL
jgi:hypothetical protein